MKKLISVFASLVLLAGMAFAEDITVTTFKGNAQFMPAVTAVLSKAGYTVKPVVVEEQGELIASIAKNETDIGFFLAQPLITQIKGAAFVPARLMSTDFCAVTKDASVVVKNSADLKKYKVGIIKGNQGHQAATRGCTNIVEAENEVAQFKLLKDGKVDVVVSVRDLIVPMCRASGLADPIVCEPPVMKNPTFLAVSAKAAAKKDALNEIFSAAMKDGSWGQELGKLKK